MRNFSYPIFTLALLSMVASCDKVKDDVAPELVLQQERFTRDATTPTVIPIFGNFDDSFTIVSTNPRAAQIGTLPYLKYEPNGVTNDIVDIQVLERGEVVARGSVEVSLHDGSRCINELFSEYHVISSDSTLFVDILENFTFCGWSYSGSVAAREQFIQNADDVLLAVSPSSADFTYTPPQGFQGTVEFIYEVCFGFNDPEGGDIFDNPIDNCEYYFSALTTIEVN